MARNQWESLRVLELGYCQYLGNLRYLETTLRNDCEELHYDDVKREEVMEESKEHTQLEAQVEVRRR
jgi:hypothetical protein